MFVDNNVIFSPGRPFLFPPRTEEGNGGNTEANGDVEDAGVTADEKRRAGENGGGFGEIGDACKVQHIRPLNNCSILPINRSTDDNNLNPFPKSRRQFSKPVPPPTALDNARPGKESHKRPSAQSGKQPVSDFGIPARNCKKRRNYLPFPITSERGEETSEAVSFIDILIVRDWMGKETPAIVGCKADLGFGPDDACHYGREAMPLLRINDNIVSTPEGIAKFRRDVVTAYRADSRAEGEDAGIAPFRENVDGELGETLAQSPHNGHQMHRIANASRADNEDRLRTGRNIMMGRDG
ncbi:hypothetical protein GPICK_08520 [Geobacter pickeringii]|uniref:Uncharacterized protein n=1 Tax=Geobacter pickeringii TaxID=345632 RepID=A0A0B5B9Y7_9BACT|nr:hypothetical protein GPICK_08520 [Geobacter pickeringii]